MDATVVTKLLVDVEEKAIQTVRFALAPLRHKVVPLLLPLLATKKARDRIINTADLSCGLLEPSGQFHACDYYGHLELSERIINLNPDLAVWGVTPDEALRQKGWVKISGETERVFFGSGVRLTHGQVEFLLNYRHNFELTYQLLLLEEAEGQWR
ncbi:MAG: hypothetical protein JW395_0775 [Nitrospira sp.]|nr:hypothetical protein [Nitrospira sp.]